MNFTIEQVAKVNTVYFRRTGAFDGESNKQLMEQLKSWAEDHQLLADATILGIPQDDPATTAKEACRYDVCLVVEDNVEVELPAQTGFFGGTFAVFQLEHTEQAISAFWNNLDQVIEREQLVVAQRPIVERYTKDLLKKHRCELLIPLLPSNCSLGSS
ncbi:LOW QUALITY PROTEIN: transcriptional regulator, AraC family [Bacillus sp. JCM 19046]|nr:LOW QUALITY PROTEIN: transcriptional regulator, AraC family [Bacillus sp. JCM 19046]